MGGGEKTRTLFWVCQGSHQLPASPTGGHSLKDIAPWGAQVGIRDGHEYLCREPFHPLACRGRGHLAQL